MWKWGGWELRRGRGGRWGGEVRWDCLEELECLAKRRGSEFDSPFFVVELDWIG